VKVLQGPCWLTNTAVKSRRAEGWERTFTPVALFRGLSPLSGKRSGAPSFALCEGWDKENVRGRASGAEQWHPTLRKEREGWGTRTFSRERRQTSIAFQRQRQTSVAFKRQRQTSVVLQ